MCPSNNASRMLKKSASVNEGYGSVEAENKKSGLCSTLTSTSAYLICSLRPCLGQGASLGEEAVLADSGREGEITAGVGRVRRLAF